MTLYSKVTLVEHVLHKRSRFPMFYLLNQICSTVKLCCFIALSHVDFMWYMHVACMLWEFPWVSQFIKNEKVPNSRLQMCAKRIFPTLRLLTCFHI